MSDIQDKEISDFDRKMRDHAIRKGKKKSKVMEVSELTTIKFV